MVSSHQAETALKLLEAAGNISHHGVIQDGVISAANAVLADYLRVHEDQRRG